MTRDEMQKEGLDCWVEANYLGTLLLGTGTGKSLVAIKAIKHLLEKRLITSCKNVLIAVSDANLRDHSWEAEFDKWKLARSYYELTIACYQTTRSWKGKHFDLIVADEFDFALSPEYSKLFTENTYDRVLGLTGFIDPSKLQMAQSIAPVLFDFSTGKAQKQGILNKSVLVGVSFELSTVRDVTVTHKNGSFKTSENDQYAFLEERVSKNLKKYHSLLNDSGPYPPDHVREEVVKAKRYWEYSVKERAKFLYSCKSSLKVVQMIKSQLMANEGNKVLIFTQRKDTAKLISPNYYTSDASATKRKELLKDLNTGKIKELSLCKALDRGANLNGINSMIFHTFTSSPTSFAQRHGRGCRLHKDSLMYFYVLVPQYKKKVVVKETNSTAFIVVPTQQRGWAVTMLSGFEPHDTNRINLGEIR